MAGWKNLIAIKAKDFRCGHPDCGREVASDKGYSSDSAGTIYICPRCQRPTYFAGGKQIPDVAPGNEVQQVPKDVNGLYLEARNCVSVSAYTASVLACRKLLMNIAVTQGARGERTLWSMSSTSPTRDLCRRMARVGLTTLGRRETRQRTRFPTWSGGDAEELIAFAEMLLKFIYEFPAKVPAAQPQAPQ